MNRAAPLRQSDLTRYAKAMRAAGVEEFRVVVKPDGTHEIIASGPGKGAATSDNPCDRLLDQ